MDLFGKKAEKRAADLEKRASELEASLNRAEIKLKELGYDEYAKVKEKSDNIMREVESKKEVASRLEQELEKERQKLVSLRQEEERLERQNRSAARKLAKVKELYKSAEYSINQFFEITPEYENCKLSKESVMNLPYEFVEFFDAI